jgi:AraC-like DNA-binding protein
MALDMNVDIFWSKTAEARRFILDLRPPPDAELAVVSGGRERCEPEYLVARESFPYHCLEFVLSGEGELEVGGKRFKLLPGSLFSYGPGVPHRIANSKNNPMTKYFVDFAGTRSDAFLEAIPLRPGEAAELGRPELLYSLFEELIRQGQAGGAQAQGICSKLLECLGQAARHSALPHGSLEGRAAEAFRKCEAYIRERYMSIGSIGEVAAACSIETAYMCRLFKRFERSSPYNLILRLRMGHAAEALRSGNPLVKEVAAACGFADQYQFSRQFKRVMGVSPERFKELAGR